MNNRLTVLLNASPEQHEKLVVLQAAFAQVCNALAPVVQQNRCWNRVTLHHLTYRSLRQQFPSMGSQMVCNAIYSVCRTARILFQNPSSPFNISREQDAKLPLLRFSDNCPVYFDRHTLSVKGGKLSMYTLDGRMRFDLALAASQEERFHSEKLREIVLARNAQGAFELSFWFAPAADAEGTADGDDENFAPGFSRQGPLVPDYVKVHVPHE